MSVSHKVFILTVLLLEFLHLNLVYLMQVEGVQHVMKMALSPMQTPNLDTPKYQVLKKMRDYEVRKYSQFMTAEVPMPSGSSAASGERHVIRQEKLLEGSATLDCKLKLSETPSTGKLAESNRDWRNSSGRML